MKRKVHSSAHMYKRVVWGKKDKPSIIYKCIIPGCTHYMHRAIVEGSICLCNRCKRKEVVITKAIISRNIVKIHCPACTRNTWNRKEDTGPSISDVQSKLDKILGLGG